jgi:uncharacterized protein (UPF0264 family)
LGRIEFGLRIATVGTAEADIVEVDIVEVGIVEVGIAEVDIVEVETAVYIVEIYFDFLVVDSIDDFSHHHHHNIDFAGYLDYYIDYSVGFPILANSLGYYY